MDVAFAVGPFLGQCCQKTSCLEVQESGDLRPLLNVDSEVALIVRNVLCTVRASDIACH